MNTYLFLSFLAVASIVTAEAPPAWMLIQSNGSATCRCNHLA